MHDINGGDDGYLFGAGGTVRLWGALPRDDEAKTCVKVIFDCRRVSVLAGHPNNFRFCPCRCNMEMICSSEHRLPGCVFPLLDAVVRLKMARYLTV